MKNQIEAGGFVGPLSNTLKKQRQSWEWTNTRCENFRVGTIISGAMDPATESPLLPVAQKEKNAYCASCVVGLTPIPLFRGRIKDGGEIFPVSCVKAYRRIRYGKLQCADRLNPANSRAREPFHNRDLPAQYRRFKAVRHVLIRGGETNVTHGFSHIAKKGLRQIDVTP
jgi:hypothetical protein